MMCVCEMEPQQSALKANVDGNGADSAKKATTRNEYYKAYYQAHKERLKQKGIDRYWAKKYKQLIK